MKKITFLVVILLMPYLVLSQEPEVKPSSKKMYIDLMIGAAVPVGSAYPSTDLNNKKAGYATTGFLVQGSFDWIGNRNFGIALQLAYQSNPINETVKEDTLDGTLYPIGTGNFQNIYLMAGPVYLQKINKLIIDVKVTGGFIISSGPPFSMTNPDTRQKDSKTATGFGLGINAGAAYEISPHVALRLGLGYMAGFPSVSEQYNATQYYDPVLQQIVYTAPAEIKISKTVSTFNAGLGIVIII
jgi:hypothetical protein